ENDAEPDRDACAQEPSHALRIRLSDTSCRHALLHVVPLEPNVVAGERARPGGVELERRNRFGRNEARRLAEVLVQLAQALEHALAQRFGVGRRLTALAEFEREREPLRRVLVLRRDEREGADSL